MSLIVNGTEIERLVFNGAELDTAFYQGVEVFTSAREVTYTLTNLTKISCPTKVKNGGTLIAQIGAISGYLTPETVNVTMNGVELTTTTTETSYYTYDANIGTITVYNCVGIINIVANSNLRYTTLWEFSGSSVTKYNGSDVDLTIPYCYKSFTRNNTRYYMTANVATAGYTNITTIASRMFFGETRLKTVTVYSPFRNIGTESFRGCPNLESFNAPNDLNSIGDSAFYGCTLLKTSRCASSIGSYAYYNCTSLTTLSGKNSSMTFSTVYGYAFYNCYSLAISNISFYRVYDYAFWNCGRINGTATLSSSVNASSTDKYMFGRFAFAKTNISTFDLVNMDTCTYFICGEGCFSSNTKWSLNYHGISKSWTYYSRDKFAAILASSTSSNDAGTYKYLYGGELDDSGGGKLTEGDYVPYTKITVYWGNIMSVSVYESNITSLHYWSGHGNIAAFDVSSTSTPGYVVDGIVEPDGQHFKSGYVNIKYRSGRYNSETCKNVWINSDWIEVSALTPTHGVFYWYEDFCYVAAESSGCIVYDTPVTLADGTTKMIQDITFKDRILRFNHDTGKVDTSYCHWINKEKFASEYYKITFSDNSFIKIIHPHAMFNLDKLKYVQVTDKNDFYIGTNVPKLVSKNGRYELENVKVTNIEIVKEQVKFCEVVTGQFFNSFANNLLVSEPLTIGFQNMYEFNEDLTYKSPLRKQYLLGQYKGLILSEEYARDKFRMTDKDIVGFRASEWGMLMEAGCVDDQSLHDMIDNFVNSDLHRVETIKDNKGNNIWPVTTDLDNTKDIDNFMLKEKSKYILPANNKVSFKGWYCSADSKIYQPGETYIVRYGTHFSEIME